MLKITATTINCALFLILSAFATPESGAPKGWKQFVNVRSGYIVSYPGSWYRFHPDLPTFYICSFPPSRAVTALVVPENGATINIVPSPPGITTIEDWVAKDSTVTRPRSRNLINLQRSAQSAPLHIVEVAFESIDGPDTLSWYFEISGRLLVANLSYWKGDPKVTEYRQVLQKMTTSIRVIN